MGITLWITVLFLTLFIFYWKKIYDFIKYRRRLIEEIEKIDGPPSLPILGTVILFKWTPAEFASQLVEWASSYLKEDSSIVRLWLGPYPIVCVISPETAKTVLESNEVITKGIDYRIIERWLGKGLLTSTGEKWRNRRKLLTPAFHFNVLNSFIKIFDEESRTLINVVEKEADNGKVFDLFPYIKRCALDIICSTSMGTTVNAQININHPYVMGVQRLNELSFEYARSPWLWIEPIWDYFGNGKEYKKTLKMVTDFTRNVIDDRSKQFKEEVLIGDGVKLDEEFTGKKRLAFLDLLLSVKDEGKLTHEDIRQEVDTFMFEGHDTTGSGMTWAIWCLAHYKEDQKKVIEEIDEIFGDSDRPCTNEDLTKLKYLEKCIKEALRLFPPVAFHTRSVENDFNINGHIIPAGSSILIPPLIVHRDNANYPNASEFNPAHFDQENISKRHPFSYIPFSAGPRNCIGQKFALMEEKTVLSWFFRKYTVDAELEWSKNLPCTEIITKPSEGCPIKIYRRRK